MKTYSATEWLPSGSGLGESPLYRASDDKFFFVDIKNKLVHSVPLGNGWEGKRTYTFNKPITRLHVVAGRTDALAVQTKRGLALLSLDTGALKDIASICHNDSSLDDQVRLNDGAVDAKGRWWAGSMALDEETAIGRLWCLDQGATEGQDASVRRLDDLVETPVPNGPVFSPDDKILYASETPSGKIFKYDYDTESGSASNKRLFAHLENGGMPDGMAVDVEGHIWVAANSTGKLVRYSSLGEAVAVCEVPGAKMASCPVFGGKDLRTLFITSIAAEGSTGHVYRVEVDIPGIERYEYRA
ncbi:rRNA-processing protein cgr1 [Cytospora paraplurivora]|uniref:rRNA-processing protein cgr1 n=1 Tax=Cytospora paraplurivora TaxID=2898453 RepID=A0AAN9UGT9_9PEZI